MHTGFSLQPLQHVFMMHRSLIPCFRAGRRSLSAWAAITPAPADPILGLVAQFKLDDFPNKVNLAQGAYRTEEKVPLVLNAVRKAEALVTNDYSLDKVR